jgi:hypothetical protein
VTQTWFLTSRTRIIFSYIGPSGHTDGARAAAPLLIFPEVTEPGRVQEKRQREANLLAVVSFSMVLCTIYISVIQLYQRDPTGMSHAFFEAITEVL